MAEGGCDCDEAKCGLGSRGGSGARMYRGDSNLICMRRIEHHTYASYMYVHN